MHESTVSAHGPAVRSPPGGEVIPSRPSLSPSLGVKDVIKNIIDAEDHSRPTPIRRSSRSCARSTGSVSRAAPSRNPRRTPILPARLRRLRAPSRSADDKETPAKPLRLELSISATDARLDSSGDRRTGVLYELVPG